MQRTLRNHKTISSHEKDERQETQKALRLCRTHINYWKRHQHRSIACRLYTGAYGNKDDRI